MGMFEQLVNLDIDVLCCDDLVGILQFNNIGCMVGFGEIVEGYLFLDIW